ncbi:hypothetical protein GX50_01138 [[Emmonsia] crescens]|uniref:Uncharacterized protein n=1 Tax=[Emmonsia] crescens TaxID=73230 RepID=A0A2B7ZRZ6_9EURO|nr:hypothetical protein GX50_01138 [Emmonsia crescens]
MDDNAPGADAAAPEIQPTFSPFFFVTASDQFPNVSQSVKADVLEDQEQSKIQFNSDIPRNADKGGHGHGDRKVSFELVCGGHGDMLGRPIATKEGEIHSQDITSIYSMIYKNTPGQST